jgi:hypothetical protein
MAYCRGQGPAVVPNRTVAVRSNCSRPPATVRPKRSCAPTASRSSRWSTLYAPGWRPRPERMVAGGKAMEIARVRITEAGRRALEAQHATTKGN